MNQLLTWVPKCMRSSIQNTVIHKQILGNEKETREQRNFHLLFSHKTGILLLGESLPER